MACSTRAPEAIMIVAGADLSRLHDSKVVTGVIA